MPYYVCDITHRCGHLQTHTLALRGEGGTVEKVATRKRTLAAKDCDLCGAPQPQNRRTPPGD